MWRFVVGILAAVFGGALVEYICGRILLPEMGLTAPGYWIWFWVMVIVVIGMNAATFLKEWME